MKTAVICMNGFEEVEGLTVVDMLRRLEIECDIVGKSSDITGSHGIVIKADKLLEEIKFFREVCLEQPTLEMTAR